MKIEIVSTNFLDVKSPIDDTPLHPSYSAWILSRPNNEVIPLDEILSLDLPVNEIPMATLFIESTILEREIITSARNHVMWAQTSRVQNVLEFDYPDSLPDHIKHFCESQRKDMRDANSLGVRQDEYRKLLPLVANTKYTVNMSMRDLISLAKYLGEASVDYPHLHCIFDKSAQAIVDVLANTFGIEMRHAMKYKGKPFIRPIGHKANNVDNSYYQEGVVGDCLSLTTRLPLSLRAQLARHRALIIQDNLEVLMRDESILYQNNEMPVDIRVTGLIDDWIDVVRKRSCWIAHYNLWSPLLNKAEEYLRLGESSLPCHNGTCPYDGDCKARYTNDDPNAPCPIHARLNGRSVTIDQLREMESQFCLDKRPQFWLNEINGFCNGGS